MLALAQMQKITANQACRTDDRTSLPSIGSPKSPVSSSMIYAVGRNPLHPPCRRARPNRHRARCTDGASPSATSCIEALPTPAVGAWGVVVMAGIRKPLQTEKCSRRVADTSAFHQKPSVDIDVHGAMTRLVWQPSRVPLSFGRSQTSPPITPAGPRLGGLARCRLESRPMSG